MVKIKDVWVIATHEKGELDVILFLDDKEKAISLAQKAVEEKGYRVLMWKAKFFEKS